MYSQADEAWIVTLTAGEIEAEHYQQMGMSKVDAAQLKGRLRAWDSLTVPQWAGVPRTLRSWAISACNWPRCVTTRINRWARAKRT